VSVPGDVIMSVNGDKVGEITHQQLVDKLRQAGDKLRLPPLAAIVAFLFNFYLINH